MRPAVALIALAVIGAGCVSLPGNLDDADDAASGFFYPETTAVRAAAATEDLSGVIDPDHGGIPYLHADPTLHEGSYGLELVGYNPLTRLQNGESVAGQDSGYGAIDVWENFVCVAHFAGSGGASGGAVIVDVADPANPVVLSSVESGMVNSDCQFTDDGNYLLLGSYTGVTDNLLMGLPPPIGDVAAQGVLVYDVSDKSAPEFLFHDAQGAGGDGYHNLFTATIGGTVWVFQTYTGNVLKFNEDMSGLELVTQIEHSNHDIWVGRHPISGDWMLVTGAGYGTAVFDVNDPANPALLGVWEGDRDNRYAGWHRQWPLENTVDGKAYMVVAGEECGNGDSLPYQVLDWTDPAELTMVGSWWVPGKPANPREAEPHLCEMNSHEFETWNGYVASGNYHAGVWLIDVGTPQRAAEPATIGYYLPVNVAQEHDGVRNTPFVWNPDVWGAYFDSRGYVITADWSSGLYVLKFEGTNVDA